MPIDKKGNKVLYKPFRGKKTPANKKFSVYVKSKTGGTRIIHFGAKNKENHSEQECLESKKGRNTSSKR